MTASEPSAKDRTTSLDLRAVVREARRLLGAHLDKAFDLEPRGVGLQFRGRASGRSELWIVPGLYAAVVPTGQAHAEGLSPLAREVRRVATGAVLSDIAEPAGERYLELTLSRASDPAPTLIAAELFGAGNLAVVSGERIAAVEHARRWAHREVRPGAAYVRPPQRTDPFGASVADIEAELARSRTDLASTLAARLNLGGPVAEEVVARGGWAPEVPASTRAHALAPEVHRLLAELLTEVGEAPRGFLVRRGEEAVDATPYRSRRWDGVAGVDVVELPTFSEAALTYFGSLQRPSATPEERAEAAERETLVRQQERQRAALAELTATVESLKRDAEAIYAHYTEAEAALTAARASPGGARSVHAALGGRNVELATDGGPREAAQRLYEEAKRLGEKLRGAREALEETERRLARPGTTAKPSPQSRTSAPARAVRWFEKFRWFVSSEGVLVLGGRDAGSNDLLVRRHLKDGDLYLHADLHGASSVVAKRPEPPGAIGEPTIREAAQWAVAFSKAWRAGLASGSAFWATPDQVSKTAAAGEFVPRGAWMVRGTKHFVADVPLVLAIGPVRYADDEYLAVAPPDAVRARGTVRLLIEPGDERDRGEREVEIARELGVSRSRLQGLLPAGGLTVRRA